MYKTILLAILVLSLTGCQQIVNEISDNAYGNEYSGIELYYSDFSGITSIDAIPSWMRSHVKYKVTNNTQSPCETLERGYCDCDGYALLYMNIAYIRFGIKPSLCLVDNSREIVDGGFINHAVVKVNGKFINAQSGIIYTGSVGYEYSFDHVFDY